MTAGDAPGDWLDREAKGEIPPPSEQLYAREAAKVFPPDLVPLLRMALPAHPALVGIDDAVLARLLTLVFFASLEVEETELHPLRVALIRSEFQKTISPERGVAASAIYNWSLLPFRRPRTCDTTTLLKLSRAASSELVFIEVAAVGGAELRIVGLAREGVRLERDPFLKFIAPAPGTLEIWAGRRRVLRYVRGQIQAVPENLLLSAGPVRRALDGLAETAGLRVAARSGYFDAVAGLVRAMASHRYGGILALSADDDPEMEGESGFRTVPVSSLTTLLAQAAGLSEAREGPDQDTAGDFLLDALRVEIDRRVAELGRLTALDGATVLDRALAVRGFGVVLPVAAGELTVMVTSNTEGTLLAPFNLRAYGARHHAAASYAQAHPGGVVFIATEDGDLGCMLRQPDAPNVLLWRFQPSDIRFG